MKKIIWGIVVVIVIVLIIIGFNKKGNNSGVIENIESKNDKVISTDISSSTF